MKPTKTDKVDIASAGDSSEKSSGSKVAKGRRAALAKAGVTGGAIAGGVWAKPMINSTVLPAHAATTDSGGDGGSGTTSTTTPAAPAAISMNGPTDLISALGSTSSHRDSQSIAARAIDAVVPRADAFNGAVPGSDARFGTSTGAAGLCVTLQFPQGNTPSGPVNVSVQGPRHYAQTYSYDSSLGQYVYTNSFDYQITGNGSTTLGGPEGLDFSVNLGQVTVEGCVTSSDFSGAEGVVIANNTIGSPESGNVIRAYYENSGNGASFSAIPDFGCRTGYGFEPELPD
ncbi:MAG: hypothetical protein AAF402_05355 [Pseudomonadota bacterium]